MELLLLKKKSDNGNFSIQSPPKLGSVPEYLQTANTGISVVKASKYDLNSKTWKKVEFIKESEGIYKGQQLKIITYNVWFAEQDFDERAAGLLEIISNEQPHIIALQEVTPRLVNIIIANKWVQDNCFISDSTGENVYPYGVMFLTRIPWTNLVFQKLVTNMARKTLIGEFYLSNGQKIKVGTVHLESLENAKTRGIQLQTIFPYLADVEHAFLMGDFNMAPADTENALINENGYIDVWPSLNPTDIGNTFRFYPRRIDRMILKSKIIKPITMKIIGNVPIRDNIYPSDHFGLCAEYNCI